MCAALRNNVHADLRGRVQKRRQPAADATLREDARATGTPALHGGRRLSAQCATSDGPKSRVSPCA
eukprot:389050-Alexandrium_andersonii.AAC.1